MSDNNLSKLSTYIGNLDHLEKLDVSKNGKFDMFYTFIFYINI